MKKHILTVLSTSLLAVLFVLCLAFASIRVAGLATFVVTGGSMEPTIHKGSLVLVQPALPAAVRTGDVITFSQYDQTTTHRVTAIERTPDGLLFTTKGDANPVADPEPKSFPAYVGIVRGALPVAGYAVAYVQAYWRMALMALAALIFLGCAATLVFRRDAVAPAPSRQTVVAFGSFQAVPVRAVDPDEVWTLHMDWLREATARRIRAA